MLKVMGIFGAPASGKTTLMRKVIAMAGKEGTWQERRLGTLDYLYNDYWSMYVLGKYDGHQFDGTDRLSMAVMKDAERFLLQQIAFGQDGVPAIILFEGDRLLYNRFLNMIVSQVPAFQFWLVHPSSAIWRERLKERTQPAEFIASRLTKIANMRKQFPFIQPIEIDNEAQMERMAIQILEWSC